MDVDQLEFWVGREELRRDLVTAAPLTSKALTFNSHRVHYHRPYAVKERYGGLVLHGPFTARGAELDEHTVSLWAQSEDGQLAMDASGRVA